jgi:hypothetical protein
MKPVPAPKPPSIVPQKRTGDGKFKSKPGKVAAQPLPTAPASTWPSGTLGYPKGAS